MEPILLRPTEAAKALAISRTSLYALLTTGEIASIKVGASRLIPVEALSTFVEGRRATPESARAAATGREASFGRRPEPR